LVGAIDIGSNFQQINENILDIGYESGADVLDLKDDILMFSKEVQADRLLEA
jgi:hypothetical protein